MSMLRRPRTDHGYAFLGVTVALVALSLLAAVVITTQGVMRAFWISVLAGVFSGLISAAIVGAFTLKRLRELFQEWNR